MSTEFEERLWFFDGDVYSGKDGVEVGRAAKDCGCEIIIYGSNLQLFTYMIKVLDQDL